MKVRVVGRADHDAVDLLFDAIEHLPKVSEATGLRKLLERLLAPLFVDVAQGDDVLPLQICKIRRPLPADADDREVELVRRTFSPSRPESVAGEKSG